MAEKKAASEVAEATARLFQRYETLVQRAIDEGASINDPEHDPKLRLENLLWMCRTGAAEADSLPIDKVSRWLGFVQGVLCMRGIVSVDGERDVSRPLFHAAYRAQGHEPPPTREGPGESH